MKHTLCRMTVYRSVGIVTTLLMLFGFVQRAEAQLSITSGATITQTFDGLGSTAAAALPTGFKMGPTAGSTFALAGSSTTLAAGTSGTGALTGTSSGGLYNYANGVTASSTDRAIGGLSSGSVAAPFYIYYAITNNTTSIITSLSVAFDYEKYRAGTAGISYSFQTSTNGTSFSAAGSGAGDQTYTADGANAVVNPPTTISKSFTLTGLGITPGSTFYLRWASSASTSNGVGIGLDNVVITPTLTPITHYYSASSGFLDNASTWWTNTDGATGSQPSDVVSAGQVFHVSNGNPGAVNASWTLGGGSRLIADGSNVSLSQPVSGTLTIYSGRTTSLLNSSMPTIDTAAGSIYFNHGGSATLNLSSYGGVTLDGAITTTLSGSTTITGNIVSASGHTGTLTLGTNTVNLGGNFVWNPSTNRLSAASASLNFNGSSAQTYSTNVTAGHTFSVTTLNNSAGLNLAGNLTSSRFVWTAGNITAIGGTTTLVGSSLSVTTLSGTGAKTFLGGGTWDGSTGINGGVLKITGVSPSTLTGGITIGSPTSTYNSGILDLGSTTAWTSTQGNITINPFSQLYLSSAATLTGVTITLSGSGTNVTSGTPTYGVGALRNATTATVAGPITITSNNATIFAGANLSLTGAITYSGELTKRGSNTLTLTSASNTGAGGFTLAEGSAVISGAGGVGTGAIKFSPVVSGAATLTLGSTNTISGLSTVWSGASITGTQTLSIASALTLNNSTDNTFGVNPDASTGTSVITGAGRFTKLGSGALILTNGGHGLTGVLTVSGGTISLTAGAVVSLGGTGGIIIDGGALQISNSAATTLGATGGIAVSSGSLQVTNSAATSLGAFTVSGGSVTLSSSAANIRTGAYNQSSGTTSITTSAALTHSGAVTLSGGSMSLSSGTTTTMASLAVSGSSAITISSGGVATTGATTLTNSTFVKTGTGGMTAASLVATGSTITFANSGTNTITSGTSITNSTLAITTTSATPLSVTGAIALNSSALLSLIPGSGTTTLTVGAVALNSGALTTSGITASNVIINGGVLTLVANSSITLDASTAHSIKFAASTGSWSGTMLTIYGWQGDYVGGSGSAGKIFVGSNASGLGATNLAKIQFSDGTNNYPAVQLSTGEVVPKASITTGAIAGSPFYNDVDNTVSVPYTYTGPISGTVSVEISDNTGSFASPTVIGTAAVGGSGSGTVSAVVIPSLTPVGTYSVRVTASTPVAVTGTSTTIVLIGHPPIITSVSGYTNNVPGSTITITGSNFNTTNTNNRVYFGAVYTTPLASSDNTHLDVVVPVGATFDNITVTDITTKLSAQSQYAFVPDFVNDYFKQSGSNLFTTQAAETFSVSNTPWNFAVGDLDGDGKQDIAIIRNGSPSGAVEVYRNTGNNGGGNDISSSSFSYHNSFTIQGGTPTGIRIADLDGDGKGDIAVAGGGGATSISLLHNTTSDFGVSSAGPTFSSNYPFSISSLATSPKILNIADYDKDGKLDIAAVCYATSPTTVVLLRNTISSLGSSAAFNAGTFAATSYSAGATFGASGSSICSSDFNNDGLLDLAVIDQVYDVSPAVTNSTVTILGNASTPGTPSFSVVKTISSVANYPTDIKAGDVDGDGKPDIVVADQLGNAVKIYHNPADGTYNFSTATSLFVTTTLSSGNPIWPGALELADMDGDGLLDILVTSTGNNALSGGHGVEGLGIYRNTNTVSGTISFSSTPVYLEGVTTSVPAGLLAADLDMDKYTDIILANNEANSFSVFRNKPVLNIGTVSSSADIFCHGSSVSLTYDASATTSPAGTTPAYATSPLPSDLSYVWASADGSNGTVDAVTGVFTGVGSGPVTAIYSLSVTGTNITAEATKDLTIRYVNVTTGASPVACEGETSASLSYSDTFGPPTHYSLTFDGTAISQGFANITNASLVSSPISIAVPGAAPFDNYNATLTVSNAFCTSDPIPVLVQLQARPDATISGSVASLCVNRDAYVVLNGTTGVNNVTYTYNGVSNMVDLVDGTDTIFIPHVSDTATFVLLSAYDGLCQSDYSDTVTINTIPQTWLGATSDWNTASNWGCAIVPTDSDYVTIPVTANDPVIGASGTGTSATLTILSGASVTLGSSAVLSVKEGLTNNGNIYGAGKVALNGTAAETISGIGYVNNVELNNTAGATINTGSRMMVKGTLTVSSGTLTTNDSLELYSDVMGTARVAALPGSGAAISGNVKVDQYIQANYRRYRFISHPFSTSISLKQLQTYMDITGTGGSANGFTTTFTNAPSAFRLDPLTSNSAATNDPGWKAFTRIDGTEADTNKLNKYQGIRLFMRGTKGQGLGAFAYTPSANTIAMRGPLNQGDQLIPMVAGTTLPGFQDYNMLGNPYASPVNIKQALTEALDSGYIIGAAAYVWNASAAFAGQYQAVPIGMGASDYYLPAYSSFQVRTAHASGDHVRFTESMKGATANTYLFKPSSNNYLSLNVYDANNHIWDYLTIRFDEQASDAEDMKLDAVKLLGADFGVYSLSSDNRMMTIDTRPFVNGKVIPLGVKSTFKQQYTFRADNMALPEGAALYLHDKLTGAYTELHTGTEYKFDITADKATQGDNRFELTLKPASAAPSFTVMLTPNPASDEVKIQFTTKAAGKVSVRVTDMLGAAVYVKELENVSNGSMTIPVAKFAAGAYMVEVVSGSDKSVQKLIKE